MEINQAEIDLKFRRIFKELFSVVGKLQTELENLSGYFLELDDDIRML